MKAPANYATAVPPQRSSVPRQSSAGGITNSQQQILAQLSLSTQNHMTQMMEMYERKRREEDDERRRQEAEMREAAAKASEEAAAATAVQLVASSKNKRAAPATWETGDIMKLVDVCRHNNLGQVSSKNPQKKGALFKKIAKELNDKYRGEREGGGARYEIEQVKNKIRSMVNEMRKMRDERGRGRPEYERGDPVWYKAFCELHEDSAEMQSDECHEDGADQLESLSSPSSNVTPQLNNLNVRDLHPSSPPPSIPILDISDPDPLISPSQVLPRNVPLPFPSPVDARDRRDLQSDPAFSASGDSEESNDDEKADSEQRAKQKSKGAGKKRRHKQAEDLAQQAKKPKVTQQEAMIAAWQQTQAEKELNKDRREREREESRERYEELRYKREQDATQRQHERDMEKARDRERRETQAAERQAALLSFLSAQQQPFTVIPPPQSLSFSSVPPSNSSVASPMYPRNV